MPFASESVFAQECLTPLNKNAITKQYQALIKIMQKIIISQGFVIKTSTGCTWQRSGTPVNSFDAKLYKSDCQPSELNYDIIAMHLPQVHCAIINMTKSSSTRCMVN